ncbi:MAG: HypC/HybG/HupF family hydrogenase formation chaperone [Tannerellaceae bacterium]|jgi:hydrogenase expression/formation protein HypC|nr:HypC/HybG/HupF family hydrogenase formation chaperone [Tannerellaceae bacterium]
MCLAVPGKIININRSVPELAMASVDFGGVIKDICIQWVDVSEGDYILAHAGLAIATVDAAEAEQTLNDLDTIARNTLKDEVFE